MNVQAGRGANPHNPGAVARGGVGHFQSTGLAPVYAALLAFGNFRSAARQNPIMEVAFFRREVHICTVFAGSK